MLHYLVKMYQMYKGQTQNYKYTKVKDQNNQIEYI